MSDSTRRALIEASSMIARREDRIQRAIKVLQAAERFDLRPMGNYLGDGMFRDDKYGEWAESQILDKVLAILQEGQQ
jgi:hypothetical protein